jgi:hypothetical protein
MLDSQLVRKEWRQAEIFQHGAIYLRKWHWLPQIDESLVWVTSRHITADSSSGGYAVASSRSGVSQRTPKNVALRILDFWVFWKSFEHIDVVDKCDRATWAQRWRKY